jgi:protein arginine kinase activator
MLGVSKVLCQNCHKRVASVHFTQVVNNDKVEMYLCKQCADDRAQFNLIASYGISSFLSGIFGGAQDSSYMTPLAKEEGCRTCGLKFSEFQKHGKMGCSECYTVFADKLLPVLRRLHGNASHVGRYPLSYSNIINRSKELDELRAKLIKVVEVEEYEKAAEIRDRIRVLEDERNG